MRIKLTAKTGGVAKYVAWLIDAYRSCRSVGFVIRPYRTRGFAIRL